MGGGLIPLPLFINNDGKERTIMKKISIIFILILTLFTMTMTNVYASSTNDPGDLKWGLYHEHTYVEDMPVQAVNLRIHIGTNYYNYSASTGLKFGTIKEFDDNPIYHGYDTPTAQYAGSNNEGEYHFLIDAPTDYKKLVIEAKSPDGNNWVQKFEGGIEQLEVLSFWDGLYFRSDNTTLYSSTMLQKLNYQESSEIFRIYFKKHLDRMNHHPMNLILFELLILMIYQIHLVD